MNRKAIKWILGFILLALLITGAVVAYRKLSPKADGGGGVVTLESTAEKTDPAPDTEQAEAGETVTVEAPSGETTAEAPSGETEAPSGESGSPGNTEVPSGESGSSADTAAETAGESEPEPFYMPDFAMIDMEGNEVRLSDYFDKPLVLNFWASWCPPCRAEMPYFDTGYQEYGDKINFIFVDLTDGSRETVDIAKDFIAEQGFSFPIYFDTTMEGAYTYGISSIPMTFFVDPGGELKAYRIGALTEEMLSGELVRMAALTE